MDPIQLYKGGKNNFNAAGLYYEYLKAIGKVGDRLTGTPIPKHLFAGTMPFIMLKPFANSALKLSDSKDIILRMTPASTYGQPVQTVNKQIWIILFEIASFRILPDGSVQTASLK